MTTSMLEAVDGVNPREWSQQPCPLCTFHHQLDAFRWSMLVRVVLDGDSDATKFVGEVGVVREWSQMGSAVHVRVQFPTPAGEDAFNHRASFYPCQLEHV